MNLLSKLFSKNATAPASAPEAPAQTQVPSRPPAPIDVSNVPVGQRVGNLTRFGTLLIAMDDITEINMRPGDGCGAEICYKNGKYTHLSAFGKALLEKYIKQEIGEVDELNRIHGM